MYTHTHTHTHTHKHTKKSHIKFTEQKTCLYKRNRRCVCNVITDKWDKWRFKFIRYCILRNGEPNTSKCIVLPQEMWKQFHPASSCFIHFTKQLFLFASFSCYREGPLLAPLVGFNFLTHPPCLASISWQNIFVEWILKNCLTIFTLDFLNKSQNFFE